MKTNSIKKLAAQCQQAAPQLATLDSDKKNLILKAMAESLLANRALISQENAKDLRAAEKQKLKNAFIDRLVLNEKRIEEMAKGLEEVADLPDPVGKIVSSWTRPNGLEVAKVRIPLGVIGVIYESRPNVTVDAAGLCFKSGNAVILRGGSEAIHSNKILGKILQDVLKKNQVNPSVVTVVPSTDRKMMVEMLKLSGLIDLIIPRGGEGLMKFVEEHSKIPVVKHDKGVCTVFVDETADIDMAVHIVENGKVQRPGVCNAVENVVVHEKISARFLPPMAAALGARGVELRGDEGTQKILEGIKKATRKDWSTEYLDLILSVKTVASLDEAIDFIRTYGSHHTESIITQNRQNAEKFIRALDSSCVLVNASTRFNDGGQLGLGAEIGISTTKLHAYGPMGLEELTATKFVVHGSGQVRG